MKRILLSATAICLLTIQALSQTVQFTMTALDATTLEIRFRPDVNIGPVVTGISNLTFVLQIPQTFPSPETGWTVTPNPAYLGAGLTTTTTSTANGPQHNTLFSWTANPNIAGTTFTATTEYLLATVTTPAGVTTQDVTLTDWGNNRIDNALVGPPLWATSLAIDGEDVTNNLMIYYDNPSSFFPFNSGDPSIQSTLNINVPLSVELISFTGKLQGKNTLLEWIVTDEKDMRLYEPEYSTDATNWTIVGRVKPKNEGAAETKYQFVHTPEAGKSVIHYRLKMTDLGGKSGYSQTISLQPGITGNGAVNLYPSVLRAGEKLQLELADDVSANHLAIFDVQGKLVQQLSVSQARNYQINTSGLISGTYYLRIISTNGQPTTLKFLIL